MAVCAVFPCPLPSAPAAYYRFDARSCAMVGARTQPLAIDPK